ncbi:MAG: ThiF family adenylyltransferase [Steroidobacteraceae bacterium]|nr:ThiF family adenylyltransferase [Steroidobacteraceae bacterium]
MNLFALSETAIDVAARQAALADPGAGGYVAFEGWVRDHNEGRRVTRLEYEAFDELATREGERIVAEAIARFGLRAATCVHRKGSLAIGDMAVWVGVSAAHRGEAFAACRYIIDEVKHRVPVWKKEHYADGDSGWVNCEHCASAPHSHSDYSRQMALPGVGSAGQARLTAARVLVVGAGGLGCPVLAYLAGAGVGTIGIVDDDRVEAGNLHRQPLFGHADIGQPKAEVAAARLRAQNPEVHAHAHAVRFGAANATALLAGYDVIVDCSDNFSTKFLVNDAAVLARKPAVLASVHQFEGQLQVVRADAQGSCLRCVWPEATRDGLVGNCAESGVLGPVPGLLGNLQAMEVLKLLLDLPGQLRDEVLLFDLLTLTQQRLRAPRCDACADGCTRAAIPVPPTQELELALTPAEAAAAGYVVIDIREPAEVAAEPVTGVDCLNIPLQQLLADPGQLTTAHPYALLCARGLRSRAAAEALLAAGVRAHSLRGGLQGHRHSCANSLSH